MCFYNTNIHLNFKDASIILENNTHLVELKSKNCALESEIHQYEDKLKKAINDKQQLLEKINDLKNIGEL